MADTPDRTAAWAARSEVVAQVAAEARRLAGDLTERPASVAAVHALSARLAKELVPHLEADMALARALRDDSVTPLTEQRMELGRLVEELDRLLLDFPRRQRKVRTLRLLATTVTAVASLLERHRAADAELGAALVGQRGALGEPDQLLLGADAAEREAARSLRFLWHPPLPPTEATVLRSNPRAWRVVVLDEPAADAVAREPNA